jgi:hypothetical protein
MDEVRWFKAIRSYILFFGGLYIARRFTGDTWEIIVCAFYLMTWGFLDAVGLIISRLIYEAYLAQLDLKHITRTVRDAVTMPGQEFAPADLSNVGGNWREYEPPAGDHSELIGNVVHELKLERVKVNRLQEVCRTQLTIRDHGITLVNGEARKRRPNGDFREKVWVVTGKFGREEFKQTILKPLYEAGGIDRAGERKNSTWEVCDWRVLELAAQGLPLPTTVKRWDENW